MEPACSLTYNFTAPLYPRKKERREKENIEEKIVNIS
jgi:hypothetical protein